MKRGSKVERVEKGGKRFYKTDRPKPPIAKLIPVAVDTLRMMFPSNGDAPSVTTVLQTLAKPALIGWAAREERKMVSAFAARLYSQLYETVDGKVPSEMFIDMLNDQLGKGAHLQLLAKASNVGTEVHNRIEWEFKGELGKERDVEPPPLTTKQAERAFTRWTEWRAQVNLKPVMTEHKIYSAIFGYGGTLDLLAEVDDAASPEPDAPFIRRTVVLDFKTGKHIYEESYLQNIAYRMALQEEGIETQGGVIVRLPKYEDDPEFDAQPVPNDPSLGPTWLSLLVVFRWVASHKESRKSSKPLDQNTSPVVEQAGV